ncbi:ABC transporter ATP-binding protein [uncultured Croceitalea sp.]|uniref:ABC transporter ATP-binding protein n=1 Tax=uncultured Croceitalea sp. TaxID=1798908 RepID=UPI003305C36D
MSLKISNLNKTYSNGVKALNGLNLEIGTGMFGLLGPNGAGKSSLMRTIATLQDVDEGSIEFNGIDVLDNQMALREVLGYLPQSFGVYPKVSAENLLNYFAVLKGITSKKERNILIDEVLEIVNLTDVRKKAVSGYSGGMKQRFGIAQILLNNPQLIIVDEPTAGLDPAERNRFLNVLREVGAKNTVIFSTHIVEDVKELCTDMAILNKGTILKQCKPTDAVAELEGKVWATTMTTDMFNSMDKEYVLSKNYNPDNTLKVRIYADSKPSEHYSQDVANLEDAYFVHINQLS